MHFKQLAVTGFISCLISFPLAAESTPKTPIKVGFGFDQGFGLTAQTKRLNGFIGNKGMSFDYHFIKEEIHIQDFNMPFHWFLGAGGFITWNGDAGVRTPIGLNLQLSNHFDTYVQAMPELELFEDLGFGLNGALGIRYQF